MKINMKMSMKKKTAALAVSVLFSAPSWAFNDFVIKNIRVEGLQRTEIGTVYSYLPVKVGDTFTDQKSNEAVKALFATGFFNDVRVEVLGNDVILSVDERPVIAEIKVTGGQDIGDKDVLATLKNNGFAESRILDEASLKAAIEELKRQYASLGKYDAVVTYEVTKLERNRAAVAVKIKEGETASIVDISILGAEAYSTSELRDLMTLSTQDWLSWFTKDDRYAKQKLAGDLETIRALYQNNGYLDFSLDSSQVEMSPDKKNIYLTIALTEGKQYKVNELKISGDTKVSVDELRPLVNLKTGSVFNREELNAGISLINDRLGEEGYSMANVNVRPLINRDKQTVDLNLVVEPGRVTYVKTIQIAGNTRTRDEVIRRELRQLEAARFNSAALKRSKERLQILGYFDEVRIDTKPVAGSPDQVDVFITVKERSTGNVSAGIGYVQNEGLQFNAAISQSNIFGSGKALSFGVNTGDVNKSANLSFSDPYYNNEGMSLGYDLYARRYSPDENDTQQYSTDTVGAAVRWGVPITEYDRVNFSLGAEQVEVTLTPTSPSQYIRFVEQNGDKNLTYLGSVSWGRDKRDSAIWPTKGYTTSLRADGGLPGGDLQYYRFTASQQWFFPVTKSVTWAIGGNLGYADPYGDTEFLPFFQNFYGGGIGSVRGFESSSLGPLDPSTGDSLGGTRKATFSTEFLFPMPGMKDDRSVRVSAFVDGGSIWDPLYQGSTFNEDFRYSAGLALAWLSPVGPIKLSYAYPINDKPGDQVERFQFTLGSTF